ncbi:LppU/SCO3897 family protein [[Kitasatospora] papulosa]|uniref:LppU/SCO3897 family protein n=1 Tax=[Kitasatospora] papulosa TaxID=1464011 RepID=UPI0036A98DF3
MTSTEIPLPLSPRQAAEGDIVTVPLPTGVTRIRIPPSQDGDLVRARVGAQEVLLRVQVTGGGSHSYPWAAFLGVAAVIGAVVLLGVIGAEDKDSSAGSPAASSTYDISSEDPYAEQTEDPYTEDPGTSEASDGAEDPVATEEPEDISTEDPFAEDPYDSGEEAPDPYESGTCLNGTLPDSTTAQEVSGVDEVSCSASDAHYQVIQTIPLTSDMSRCDANSATQYAFSYRYTLDGATLNEYVYCLIGLGSYAR